MANNEIKQLSPQVASMIAAGEVVERPLSVVKELVENSIDAGATALTVEIKAGGKDYIRVADNGCGIDRRQFRSAFKRFATSKISSEEDLNSINTLGFRGEALASIAAVSKVTLISKTEEAKCGASVSVSGDNLKAVSDAACEKGTTFIIRNLFYNTPARQKFLKSDNTEAALIIDFVSRVATAYPQIAVKLISSGNILFSTTGSGDLLSAITIVYGPEIARNLVPIEFDDGVRNVHGYVSAPTFSKNNRQWQTFFVNGRFVKSRLLEETIAMAYRDKLFKDEYPIVFLSVNVPPTSIDVNVHPHKTEIKFYEEEDLKEFMVQAVRMGLLNPNALNVTKYTKADAAVSKLQAKHEAKEYHAAKEKAEAELKMKAEAKRAEEEELKRNQKKADSIEEAKDEEKNQESEEFVEKETSADDDKSLEQILSDTSNSNEKEPSEDEIELKEEPSAEIKSNDEPIEGEVSSKEEAKNDEEIVDAEEDDDEMTIDDLALELEKNDLPLNVSMNIFKEEKPLVEEVEVQEEVIAYKPGKKQFRFRSLIYIGQAFNTYLLCKDEDNLYIIDQHAAHERVMYEKLLSSFNGQENLRQPILEPIVIDLSMAQKTAALESLNIINKMGFWVEEFGPASFIAKEVPACMSLREAEVFLDQFFDAADEHIGNIQAKREVITSRSCKAAVKAHDKLSENEIARLFIDLDECDNPFSCPHGRPTFLKFTSYEIERMFKRK